MNPDMTLTEEITAAVTAQLTLDARVAVNDHRIPLLVVGQTRLVMVCQAFRASVSNLDSLEMADIVFVASQAADSMQTSDLPDDLRLWSVSCDELIEAQGCLCCSMRSEIASVLSRLFLQVLRREQPKVRLVVLLTSGSDVGPLKQALRHAPFLGQRYRFVGTVGM